MNLPLLRVASTFALLCCAALTWAQAPTTAAASANGARLAPRESTPIKPGSVEERIRNLVRERLGQAPESVVRTSFGMYEVIVSGDIVYVDPEANYLLAGRLIDMRTRTDLTEQKRNDLSRVDFKSLPLDQAIKQVRGNGKRVLVTFEDPNCGYCRQLARTLTELKDVTVYTFLLPILSQDSMEKSTAIWCSKDRAAAWQATMVEGKAPAAPATECATPLQSNLAIGQALRVNGTPTLVFADGWRVPGIMPLEGIEQALTQHSGTGNNAAPAKK